MSQQSYAKQSVETGTTSATQSPEEPGYGNSAANEALGPRRAEGSGGYVYDQYPDGTLVIVDAPGGRGVGVELGAGAAFDSISAEIGPYPAPPELTPTAPIAPTAIEAAEDPGQQSILDVVVEELGGLGEATGAFVDDLGDVAGYALSSFVEWWRDEDEGPAPTEQGSAEQLGDYGPPAPDEVLADHTVSQREEEPSGAYARYAYDSQRDNDFEQSNAFEQKTALIHGDNMCNVTTLAMQLKALAADDAQLQSAAVDMLIDCGGGGTRESLMAAQLEDLLMQIFVELGETYFEGACRGYRAGSSYGPHQYAICLAHVGELFTDYVHGSKQLSGGTSGSGTLGKDAQGFYEGEIMPHLDAGAAIMLSTKLTGGHIVLLVDIMSDGVVIHDPYGMRLPAGYVKNGDRVSSRGGRIASAGQVYEDRVHENDGLRSEIDERVEAGSGTFGHHLGEVNFYPWAEVQSYAIGQWVSVLSARA